MDILTIGGVIFGLGLVLWGILMGSPLSAFVSWSGMMITLGGSFGAMLVNFQLGQIRQVMKITMQVIFEKKADISSLGQLFVNLAQKSRREGLLALEDDLEEIEARMREIIKAFQAASARISRVITNLKEFAMPEDSSRKKPVKVGEIIQGALTIVSSQIRKTVSHIEQDISGNIPHFQGHPQRIEQVIANLLINAHQAIPPGRKGRISIRARFIARLRAIIIEIEDNGKGMEKVVLDNIFNPFYTTRRDSGGTGLGLSISYGLVKEHNGIIGVLSRRGVGSRFTIYMPDDDKFKLSLCPATLCIGSDSGFLKEIKTSLVNAVTWTVKQQDSLDDIGGFIREYPEIDIVLMDADTILDGWKLLKYLKEKFPLIPVFMYSKDPEVLNKKEIDVEPDALFRRPFSFELLQKIIHETGRQRL